MQSVASSIRNPESESVIRIWRVEKWIVNRSLSPNSRGKIKEEEKGYEIYLFYFFLVLSFVVGKRLRMMTWTAECGFITFTLTQRVSLRLRKHYVWLLFFNYARWVYIQFGKKSKKVNISNRYINLINLIVKYRFLFLQWHKKKRI